MRKLAPVFFSSILVVTSGTALALGDMHKNKKAPSTDNPSQTYGNPSSASSSADTNAVAPSTDTSKPEAARKPGNAASTPDARIQRDNDDETNTPNNPNNPSSSASAAGGGSSSAK